MKVPRSTAIPIDFSLLVESDADAIIVFDTSLCYLYVNSAAERLLGRERDYLLGKSLHEVFPAARTASPYYEPMVRCLTENRPLTVEAKSWLTGRWQEIRMSPFGGDPAHGLVLHFRDVTDRVERERRERFLASLAERARTLADDPDAVIADAVRSLGEFLGASRCAYVEVDLEARTATAYPDYCADGVASMAGVYPLGIYDEAMLADFTAGRVLVQEDVRNDPVRVPSERLPAYEALNIRSRIVAPLVRSTRLVSTIGVHCHQPRQWTPEEAELVRNVVERTWLTVEVARHHTTREQNEERLRLAVEGADIGTWHWDIVRDTVVWSDRGKRIFGFSPDIDMTFQMAESRIHPSHHDRVMQAVSRAIQDKTDYAEEYPIVWDDGSERWILARGHAYYDAAGNPTRLEGVVLDLTERRRQEDEIKRLNECLIQMVLEIHHRVKNNLQMIAGLIDIQSQRLDRMGDPVRWTFAERVKNQVMSLAAIHDLLPKRVEELSSPGKVPIMPLVERLVSLHATVRNIAIHCDIADIFLPARDATALATIVNELVCNAVRSGKSEVDVTLSAVGSEGQLTVTDDGPGYPMNFDASQQANIGLELVLFLTEHNLEGQAEFTNRIQGGAQVTIRFPLK